MVDIEKNITIRIRLKNFIDDFKKPMTETSKQFRQHFTDTEKIKGSYAKTSSKAKMLGTTFRKNTTGLHGFRMELLSVMFGAQMLSRAIFGLMNNSLQAFGVYEVWGNFWTLFFLPQAAKTLQWSLDLQESLMKIPGPIQEIIGWFLYAIGVAGIFLALDAQFGLFAGGLITAFGVTGASGAIWLVVAALLGVVFASTRLVKVKEISDDLGSSTEESKKRLEEYRNTWGGTFLKAAAEINPLLALILRLKEFWEAAANAKERFFGGKKAVTTKPTPVTKAATTGERIGEGFTLRPGEDPFGPIDAYRRGGVEGLERYRLERESLDININISGELANIQAQINAQMKEMQRQINMQVYNSTTTTTGG